MLPYITEAVYKHRGRADWIVINDLIPRVLYVSPDHEVEVGKHSVCVITSATGEQYVADFTIEQFGYDSAMWFMKRIDYHKWVCNGGCGISASEDWYEWMDMLTGDVEEQPFLYNIWQATRKACGVVGVVGAKAFEELQGQERMSWMRERAVEAVIFYDK